MPYRRVGKLAVCVLRGLITSKTVSRNSISRIHSASFSSSAYSYLDKPTPQFRKSQCSPFLGFAKRYYHGNYNKDRYRPVLDFAKRYYHDNKHRYRVYHDWVMADSKRLLATALVGSGLLVATLAGRFETIPYSKRTHFVILRPKWEKKLGKYIFKKMTKEEFEGRILPSTHPKSVRVRRIAEEITDALQRGTGHKPGNNKALMHNNGENKSIENKSGRKSLWRKRYAVSHLDGMEWEIVVVAEYAVNAMCLPGGKIVVYTGLLDSFQSDAEIATVIAHEVGHAVARHIAEGITKGMWLTILELIVHVFIDLDQNSAAMLSKLTDALLRLPFSRRMEMEADYIGLMLLASAGYDPRLAPGVYEKLQKLDGASSNEKDYFSTHPSGKRRAERLSKPRIMEQALSLYTGSKHIRIPYHEKESDQFHQFS